MLRTALLLTVLAAPAAAQRAAFELPEGCTAYATIQKQACVVTHLYRCEGDPDGWQWRVDIEENGPTFYSTIDAETRWQESHHLIAGVVERLEPGAADPASFSTLIGTGRDDFDFTTIDDQGDRTRYVGVDRLTGESVEVDGVVLDRTEFDVTATDPGSGVTLWTSTGSEYIQRDWRTFVSGTSTVTNSEETYDQDLTPVEIRLPGEEGFLSAHPKFGCGALMSALPAPLTLTGSL